MKIAVLSCEPKAYSTSRLVKEGEQRGHQIRVVNPACCNLVIEQKKPFIYYQGKRLPKLDAIIPRIGTSATFFSSAVIRQFEVMKTLTTLSSVSLIRTRDHLACIQALTKAGLDMPRTVFTNYSNDIQGMMDAVGGPPVIIKLLSDNLKVEGVLAESAKSAASVIEAFNDLRARMIVQEYVNEAAGEELIVFVVSGKVVGSIQRQGKVSYGKAHFIKKVLSKKVALSKEEEDAAVRAAAALKLNVASINMLRSFRGPLINQINSSPSLRSIELVTGENIAGAIFDYIENKGRLTAIEPLKIRA
ncbi:MAG: RimK family alpha-L-glutamate ligase [Chitinophagales bacterium]|nr:RimK family alpha-L-glutamate ligase [Chitinophagales bacterium]